LGAAEAGGCLCGVEGSVDGVVTDARAGPISPKLNKERKGYTESISKWTSQQSRFFSRCLEISPSQSFSLFFFSACFTRDRKSPYKTMFSSEPSREVDWKIFLFFFFLESCHFGGDISTGSCSRILRQPVTSPPWPKMLRCCFCLFFFLQSHTWA
jgi:hypothetical protein